MKRVLIVEDELPARQRIIRLLSQVAPDFEIIGQFDSIESTVRFLKTSTPDLILLDIQLGDGLSFEIFKQTEVLSPVIFTTAYDEYIFRAFELNSIDYLLKPIEPAALERSITKFRKYHQQLIPDQLLMAGMTGKPDKLYKQRFLVGSGSSLLSVKTEDVAYFFSMGKSVFLMSKEGKSYDIDFSLEKLENMVSEKDFFRINRQFLVHISAIKRISVLSKSRIKVVMDPDFNSEVVVSNARTHQFRQWLDN